MLRVLLSLTCHKGSLETKLKGDMRWVLREDKACKVITWESQACSFAVFWRFLFTRADAKDVCLTYRVAETGHGGRWRNTGEVCSPIFARGEWIQSWGKGLLPSLPQAVPLGRLLFHPGRQDAGHHALASGDRSRETTPCKQNIWKLFKVYFLTHLQESGHLRRRFMGWREPRGFSQVGAVF